MLTNVGYNYVHVYLPLECVDPVPYQRTNPSTYKVYKLQKNVPANNCLPKVLCMSGPVPRLIQAF